MGPFTRYVALGDSTTEGLDDPLPGGGFRGWADRLAERLALVDPAVRYANLALRGRRTRQVRATQLDPALALAPDLASVVAGLNDLLRPRCDLGEVMGHMEAMLGALAGAGATVLTVTLPDLSSFMPVARLARRRLVAYNAGMLRVAAATGAVLVDLEREPVACDPRLWSADRLHANPEGHERIAAAAAEALALPDAGRAWAEPLPVPAARRRHEALAAELAWSRRYMVPWVLRRARGRSSGDGVTAKRPEPAPVVSATSTRTSETPSGGPT